MATRPMRAANGKATAPVSPKNATPKSSSRGFSVLSLLVIAVLLIQSFMNSKCQTGWSGGFNQLAGTLGMTVLPPQSDQILSGHYDVCIAGAGLSGSVLAERYASQLKQKVLVVEKRDHIGGNCYDYTDEETGVRVSQYGAHLFHTYYDNVWNYVQNFGPWDKYEHKVRGIVNGKVVPIPVNIETVNSLFDLNIQSQEEMDEWLKKEQIPVPGGGEAKNSEEVALSRVGQRLYDLIFKPYTFKQWNKYPVELGPEVLQRIPVRNNYEDRYFSDPHQALPRHGYTSLFENMLKSRDITVLTNTDYFALRDKVSCGRLYFTGPIDAYFAHHNLPKLEYRSLDFERKVALNTKFFQPAFVVNHPQDNDDYTRIVEYKHLYDQGHLPHTVYFIERSSDHGEPYYPVPNKRNKDLFAQYQGLAQLEEQTKNVSFVGRLANYKYFNMDQAIKNALELFEKDTGIPYEFTDHDKLQNSQSVQRLQFSRAIPADERNRKGGLLQEWRQAVDCSAWDNSCASITELENRYKPYPFPLSKSIKKDKFNHEPMTDVPQEWMAALNVDNSIDKPPSRPVEYIYPDEVSEEEKQKCINDANTLDWQVQIDNLLTSGRIKREEMTNMLVFTISDYNYAYDMMHDFFEMNANVVGYKDAMFMVALDKETVEMACTYGYPMVSWPSARPNDAGEDLKHAVANTKFEVSLELVVKGYDFFFYEMDVWFIKSPKELISYFHEEDTQDILLSSHQNCPMCVNIGVYSVSANERTKEYFETCVLMAKESPNTHDQWIMAQVLALSKNYRELGKANMKFDGRWEEPKPVTNPPPINYPVKHGYYNAFEIVAGERPIVTRNTYAVHTLCGAPLMKPFGKKIMAKELAAWTGFTGPSGDGGYYARTGERRRYITMDGHDSPSAYNLMQNFEWDGWESDMFHGIESYRWTMATLLALARRTGRIFIMPKIIAEHGTHYLWTIMDFEPVEEMGIDFRETNFPHNPKAWHSAEDPFPSFARTAMAPIEVNGKKKEAAMYVQYPNAAKGEDGEIKAWKFEEGMTDENALDAWWAVHTAIPEIDSAELLLVNPHFVSNGYADKLIRKRNRPGGYTKAEQEIVDVYDRLKWCTDKALPIVIFENIIGRSSANYACHGKGKISKHAPGGEV